MINEMNIKQILYPTDNINGYFNQNFELIYSPANWNEIKDGFSYTCFMTYHWVRYKFNLMSYNESGMVFLDWLNEHNIKLDSPLIRISVIGQLYGPPDKINVRNALAWEVPSLFITVSLGLAKRLSVGYQNLWKRLSETYNMNIKYNSYVSTVTSLNNNSVKIDIANNSSQSFNHVFVTVPLDTITTPISDKLSQTGTFNDSYIISTLITIPNNTWPFNVEQVYMFDNIKLKTITYIDSYPKFELNFSSSFNTLWFLSRTNIFEITSFYPAYTKNLPIPYSVQEKLAYSRFDELSNLLNITANLFSLNQTSVTRYNIHFSSEQLKNDIPKYISNMQGSGNVWYSGGSITHWNVDAISDFNWVLGRKFAFSQNFWDIKSWMFPFNYPIWRETTEY
jgi:hypothetical protein